MHKISNKIIIIEIKPQKNLPRQALPSLSADCLFALLQNSVVY